MNGDDDDDIGMDDIHTAPFPSGDDEVDAVEVVVYKVEIEKREGEDIETRAIHMITQDGFVQVVKPCGFDQRARGAMGHMVGQGPVDMYVSHVVSMDNVEEARCEPVEEKTIHPEESGEGPGIDL